MLRWEGVSSGPAQRAGGTPGTFAFLPRSFEFLSGRVTCQTCGMEFVAMCVSVRPLSQTVFEIFVFKVRNPPCFIFVFNSVFLVFAHMTV